MARKRHTLGPLIAYHGCTRSVAEEVLSGKIELHPSVNEYDWLGPGTYFWVDSPERGWDWAKALLTQKTSADEPYVLGALVYPQLCLNLTDYGVIPELKAAYRHLESITAAAGISLPENTLAKHGIFLYRALDCAVINIMHRIRIEAKEPAYDTVYGLFEEGSAVYPGAGFRHKTHVQIAVRNPECILGYFRVKDLGRC